VGPTRWLEEGDSLSVTIRCARDGRVPALDALPRGATFDTGTGELRWRPGLDQAGVYTVIARAGGERVPLVIGVADRFTDPANIPPVDPVAYGEEMGVPVLHLRVDPGAPPHDYVPATVVFRGHVFRARAKVRGRSSLDYPQRNYTIKFQGADRFSEPGAGMIGRRTIALTSTFDDNSLLRQRLAFALWNRLAPGGVQIRHFSAVVFLDGRYHGVYTVTDHVDTDLLARQGLPTGGSLFRAVAHDAGFAPGPFRRAAFEKRSGFRGPAWLGSYDDLRSLWQLVANAEPRQFAREAPGRLALDEYRAWLIAVTAMQAEDSLAKNAFHYLEPSGRWRVVPWDFNQSWGQDWVTGRVRADLDPAVLIARNHLFGRLWEEPTFAVGTRARYAAALRGEISLPVVRALVDRLVAEVGPAARRNEQRWAAAYRAFPRWRGRTDFVDQGAEVAYLRRWVDDRWAYLLTRLR
jgi:hypothetical protein